MYERAVRKQAARQEELAASGKSEKLRRYGELLSANLYLAQKGMKSITVPNWYDEGKEVTIPLDLRFSPSQNAQNFFKNYKRSRPRPGCWWTCWQRAKRRSPIWKRSSTRWRRPPVKRHSMRSVPSSRARAT